MTLPNLELLKYMAIQAFVADKERFCLYKSLKNYKLSGEMFDCEMFSQIWGSTATAFDALEDGEPVMAAQEITKAYTVVFHEPMTNTYIVCVDNKLCYQVSVPNQIFLDDLKNKQLKPLSEARMCY